MGCLPPRCAVLALSTLWFFGGLSSRAWADPGAIAAQVRVETFRHVLDDVLYTQLGHDRGPDGAERVAARDAAAALLSEFGLDVQLEPFEYDGGTYYNVVATQTGVTTSETYYLLGAHIDSAGTPGADAGASGVAGLLEIARILSAYDTDLSIRYVLFDLNVPGRIGSQAYVTAHAADAPYRVITLEQIGWNNGETAVKVRSESGSNAFAAGVTAAFVTYAPGITAITGVKYQLGDQYSFEATGIRGCALIEQNANQNPNAGTETDSTETSGYIDYEYAANVTRGVAGFLAESVGAATPFDCDGDGTEDAAQIAADPSLDCNANGVLDACEYLGDVDCNSNGVADLCDVLAGSVYDCNGNLIPDECEPDGLRDCNLNGTPDFCEIRSGAANDCNRNGVPDECDPDTNGNGVPDDCEPPGLMIAPQISMTRFRRLIDEELYTRFGDNRGRTGPEHDLARDRIFDTFAAMGLSVELHPFTYSSATYYNVVATQLGTVAPDVQYVLGAHYDSASNPGADDDASGVAGLLEVARVLSLYDTDYTIKYIAFDLEEQGLVGSSAYASEHRTDDIRAMIQFDMIVYSNGDRTTTVDGFDATLQYALIDAVALYGNGLDTIYRHFNGASDHYSFYLNGGVPAALLSEPDYSANPCYHQACDTSDSPGYLDYELGADIARSAAGYLADVTHAAPPYDCDGDGESDAEQIAANPALDCNGNHILDTCESGGLDDCDANGVSDLCELAAGTNTDCNGNGLPDECEPGFDVDCNGNDIPDECDFADHTSTDVNGNGVPDECEPTRTYYIDDDGAADPAPGDPSVSDPDEDGSPEHPFDSIQEAIDRATSGDEIVLADGVYSGVGNRGVNVGPRAVRIRSENGPRNCVIDCERRNLAFSFPWGADGCELRGLTIRNGWSYYGGALTAQHCELTLRDCIIHDCQAGYYGGALDLDTTPTTLINCVLQHNRTTAPLEGEGGAIRAERSPLTIVNCTILDNEAQSTGGAINCRRSPTKIVNSILWSNRSQSGSQLNINRALSQVTVDHSVVQGGPAGVVIENNATLTWGDGNWTSKPGLSFLADPALTAGSPCVDGGTLDPNLPIPDADLNGAPRIIDGNLDGGAQPDIGAFEFDPQRATISVSQPEPTVAHSAAADPTLRVDFEVRNAGGGALPWRIVEDCDWLDAAPATGVSTGEADPVVLSIDAGALSHGEHICTFTVVDDASVAADRTVTLHLLRNTTLHVPSAYTTIGEAVDAAIEGDVVLLADGVYSGSGNVKTKVRRKNIVIRGENAETCVIDGEGVSRAIEFDQFTTQATLVENVTFRNCFSTGYGAALYCYLASPRIRNCRFEYGESPVGSAVNVSQGGTTFDGCSFIGNVATTAYGTIYASQAILEVANCSFIDNQAPAQGAALGMSQSTANIVNSIFVDNARNSKATIYVNNAQATFSNCTIANNAADSGPVLDVLVSSVELANTIFWGNQTNDSREVRVWSSGVLTVQYCNIEHGEAAIDNQSELNWLDGNIDTAPLFADPNSGDFHLAAGSACIDAGRNAAVAADLVDLDRDGNVTETTPLDLDCESRFFDDPTMPDTGCGRVAIVDMGAYEFGGDGPQPCFGDLNGDRLVDLTDLGITLSFYDAGPGGDLDCDGDTDLEDLSTVLTFFGTRCP